MSSSDTPTPQEWLQRELSAWVKEGIIMLLAHNWDQMRRPGRMVVGFLPLVLSQAIAFWMLWTDRGGTWGRECVGTFVALMAGACIAVISQTYHLGGDFAQFMLTWTLLSLPVAYLMHATLPAIWYCVAIIIWGSSLGWGQRAEAIWMWPLLVLILPLWWLEVRKDRFRPRTVLLTWAVVGVGCFATVLSLESVVSPKLLMLANGAWYAFLYLAGRRWFEGGKSIWRRPLQFVGVVGSTVLALILTYLEDWRYESIDLRLAGSAGKWASWLVCGVCVLPAAILWIVSLRRRDLPSIVVGALPVLIAASLTLTDGGALMALVFNLYVFVSGIILLVEGVRTQRLGTVNGGMAIISALVLCRFFDSEMGFILRGVAFIVLGAAFIATNFILLRRKGAAATA